MHPFGAAIGAARGRVMTADYRDSFDAIEKKWQERWDRERAFAAPRLPGPRRFYCLEMLPYPSGRLHMGHVRNYSIGDAVARFRRMRGETVLHPMGWDSFGLPAENAAIQRGIHPERWTEDNIAQMGVQLRRLGLSYDWDREIAAHRPDYYRWNQWFFLRMLEKDLAYRSRRRVNWCGSCRTVLANEQVEAGRCWRCDSVVGTRDLEQWFLRITRYAEELNAELDSLTGWPEKVRLMQRNWIGRSAGARVRFPLVGAAAGGDDGTIEIFTTRLDTIFGATFCVVAPDHPVVRRAPSSGPARAELDRFLERTAAREPVRPGEAPEDKDGVDTGLRVRNPYSGEILPVWTANFVLLEYGTGAIMAVPAHDDRDFEFATRFGLPIRTVIRPAGAPPSPVRSAGAFIEDGILAGSGRYDGLASAAAREAMLKDGATAGFAEGVVNYRLLDWGISRQRYWGTPIPVVYCDGCGVVPVPDRDLPVLLPRDVPFSGSGGSPLEQVEAFVRCACPRCGGPARRETDTMDTFVDSSWYFYRYADARNPGAPFDRVVAGGWLPIDLYIGGITHATMHLIYCRFFTKVLRDLGLVPFGEPVRNLLCQGMVLKGGTAMSKSKGNIVDPDEMVRRYGADTTRLFTLFAAPPEKDLEWNEAGVEGCFRFLDRVWRLIAPRASRLAAEPDPGPADGADDPRRAALRRKVHQTIARITFDLDRRLHLNTPVAALMELTNAIQDFDRDPRPDDGPFLKEAGRAMALLLQPFAPHVSEEIWSMLGGDGAVAGHPWPEPESAWLVQDEVEIVVQVNGRVRARLRVAATAGVSEVLALARDQAGVAAHTQGKTIRRTVYVPGKLLNLVV
jgi:leucyl-tRNA synthetase